MIQILSSCGETKQNSDEAAEISGITEAAVTNNETSEEVDEYQQALSSLEDYDFDGHTFNILARIVDNPEWIIWRNRDIIADEINGEVINDAIFERNSYIITRYNCDITQYQTYSPTADLDLSIKSGDKAYDVALPALADSIVNASNGLFYDLKNIESINLTSPWWDQNANANLSILNKLYFTSADMLILNNDSTGAIVFNKQLIEDWHIDNPYELVRDGKWTIDNFYEQISNVSVDLNGDGVMNGQDQFGFMLYADAEHCFYHGAGLFYASKNENDELVMTYNNEHSIDVLTRVFEIMNNKEVTYSLHNAYNEFSGSAFVWGEGIFESNRALYYWLRLRDIEGLRTMEADFGILPIPKWTEEQEKYYATVNYYVSCSIAIPLCTYEPELTGIFLEAMNCVSKFRLQPAYYDITLTGKYPRDVESTDMLDIIFDNRVYDIGMFSNFGGITANLKTMLIADDRNFASAFKKGEKLTNKEMSRVVKKFEELDY